MPVLFRLLVTNGIKGDTNRLFRDLNSVRMCGPPAKAVQIRYITCLCLCIILGQLYRFDGRFLYCFVFQLILEIPHATVFPCHSKINIRVFFLFWKCCSRNHYHSGIFHSYQYIPSNPDCHDTALNGGLVFLKPVLPVLPFFQMLALILVFCCLLLDPIGI